MIKLLGRANLMTKPDNKVEEPNKIQSKFSWNVRSTVFIDSPPYFTIVN